MVSAVQFRPWPPTFAPDDNPSASPFLQHSKQRLADGGELTFAVFHHRVEQVAFHLRQRTADRRDGSGTSIAIERVFRVVRLDRLEPAAEFLFNRAAISHAMLSSALEPEVNRQLCTCSGDNLVRIII